MDPKKTAASQCAVLGRQVEMLLAGLKLRLTLPSRIQPIETSLKAPAQVASGFSVFTLPFSSVCFDPIIN
jgi:hypothetical protein